MSLLTGRQLFSPWSGAAVGGRNPGILLRWLSVVSSDGWRSAETSESPNYQWQRCVVNASAHTLRHMHARTRARTRAHPGSGPCGGDRCFFTGLTVSLHLVEGTAWCTQRHANTRTHTHVHTLVCLLPWRTNIHTHTQICSVMRKPHMHTHTNYTRIEGPNSIHKRLNTFQCFLLFSVPTTSCNTKGLKCLSC